MTLSNRLTRLPLTKPVMEAWLASPLHEDTGSVVTVRYADGTGQCFGDECLPLYVEGLAFEADEVQNFLDTDFYAIVDNVVL